MRKILGVACTGVMAAACGGGGDETRPLEAPPPPTVASNEVSAPLPPPPVVEKPKPTLADLEKRVLQSARDSINAHDASKYAAIYTDDAVVKIAGMPDVAGKDAIQKEATGWLTAFPNVKFGIGRAWAKDDVLVSEWVMSGTHSGEYMGIKATEKPIGLTGLTISWVTPDGKVKEEHRYSDASTVLAQLGTGQKGKKTRAIPTIPTATEWHWAKGTPDEDKNVDLAKAMHAAFEKKDEAAFVGADADTIEWDDLTMPGPSKGKPEARKFFAAITAAFPDLKMTTTNAWGVEDFAIAEGTMTGTHKGPLMGIPATKKAASMHGVDVVQTKDGKAIKGWSYGNSAELLGQLGLTPPPGPRPKKK